MLFPYWCRLVCLALCSAGVIQAVLALLLRLLTPILHRAFAGLSTRGVERACFAVPVASHLAAFLLVALMIVPGYIHNETNLAGERVGLYCVFGSMLVAARYFYALSRAFRLMRGSLRPAEVVALSGTDLPIRLTQGDYPPLAVAGFFSPEIFVSRRLLDAAVLSPKALQVAFDHERAHLRQFDNFKLLILSALDLPLLSSSVVRSWRRAAEFAADDEAVAGVRSRAILLAEALLTAAQSVPAQPQGTLMLHLLPHEEDLEDRIHRLLRNDAPGRRIARTSSMLSLSLLVAGPVSILIASAAAPIHEWAEFLLHLG